jgi:uncharacterized membrane protein YgcG
MAVTMRPAGGRWPALILALALSGAAGSAALAARTAPGFPPLTDRVVDEAALLSPAERLGLAEALAQHERDTGRKVVVVTLPSLGGRSIEAYGERLGRHWGILAGGDAGGVLFIIAPGERKVRIEAGGDGDGALAAATSRRIIDGVVLPAFRAGTFGPGIVAGTGAILQALAAGPPPQPPPAPPSPPDLAVGLALLALLLLGAWWLAGRRRSAPPGTAPRPGLISGFGNDRIGPARTAHPAADAVGADPGGPPHGAAAPGAAARAW